MILSIILLYYYLGSKDGEHSHFQGLSSYRPLGQARRDPGNEVGMARCLECSLPTNGSRVRIPDLGPVQNLKALETVFRPIKPQQNFDPYYYRAVLFIYSYYEQRIPSYKKFQEYTLLCFQIQMNLKWLCGPKKFPGLQ